MYDVTRGRSEWQSSGNHFPFLSFFLFSFFKQLFGVSFWRTIFHFWHPQMNSTVVRVVEFPLPNLPKSALILMSLWSSQRVLHGRKWMLLCLFKTGVRAVVRIIWCVLSCTHTHPNTNTFNYELACSVHTCWYLHKSKTLCL